MTSICVIFFRITALLALSMLMSSTLSCRPRSDSNSGSELDGTWISMCRTQTDQLGSSFFERQTLVFAGTKMTSALRSYSDQNCQTELNTKPILGSVSTFSIGDFVVGAAGAKKFNRQTETLTITLTTDDYVALYNGNASTSAYCGGGFVKNVPKELTANSCASNAAARAEFDMEYDIFKVADGLLYFGYMTAAGTATDGRSETARPVALDPSVFTKSP
jgi:hypothetical protein